MARRRRKAIGVTLNKLELARHMGVTPAMVTDWINRGVPHSKDGRAYEFDSAAVRGWELDDLEERLRAQFQTQHSDPRLAKAQVETQIKEIQLLKEIESVLAIEPLAALLGEGLTRLRSALYSGLKPLAADLARDREAISCHALLREYVDRSFGELSAGSDQSGDRDPSRELARRTIQGASEASAEAHSEPVGGSLSDPESGELSDAGEMAH